VFESIQGRLALREPTRAVVEAGGIGYLVHVPLSTSEALPAVGKEARLFLHPVVREDEWRLFGFATSREREVFRSLLRVSGVGPAVGLTLLSGLGCDEVVRAIATGDARALTRVKGVGRKTAERAIVELRGAFKDGAPGSVASAEPAGPSGDAVRALEALGMDPTEARRRVQAQLLLAGPKLPVPDIVRAALRG
jgi:Holliday junction DNA helicase RuvA